MGGTMKALLVLVGCVIISTNRVTHGAKKDDEPLPLIPCKSEEDCGTRCNASENPKACSSLTICDDGVRFSHMKKDEKANPGAKAYRQLDTEEDDGDKWTQWPDATAGTSGLPEGVCSDQKSCATDEDCPTLEYSFSNKKGKKGRTVQLKCREAKCHWDHDFGFWDLPTAPFIPAKEKE